MKIKSIIIVFLVLIFFSCGKNKYEKQILGTWYALNEEIKLEFYKDSLFISDIQNQRSLWRADKSEINHDYKVFLSDSIVNISLNYRLNKTKDSLTINPDKNSSEEIVFIKAENFNDFLAKKNEIEFKLEKNEKADYFGISRKFEIKIFISYFNNSVIGKSEYSKNLKNLENDFKYHIAKFKNELKDVYDSNFLNSEKNNKIEFENWAKRYIYYTVFIDKNVPKKELTKQIEFLKESNIKKVYQIYYTKEINRNNMGNYIHFNNLKGIKR